MNCDLEHTVLINGSYHGTYYSFAAVQNVRDLNQDRDCKIEVYTKRIMRVNDKMKIEEIK